MKRHINGASWWKFDFHNHTPVSNDYGKGEQAAKQISPKDWLLNYMNAGIDCVAITDHNSGQWVDTLKTALDELKSEKPEGYRPLWLFPGVEITAQQNVHILAIFDTTTTSAEIAGLLGAVGFPMQHMGTSDGVTDKSLIQVLEEINKLGGIAIPAHVDKPSGIFEMCKGHTLKQAFETEGLLAIEVIDKAYTKPEIYKQLDLHLSEVVGTDSHHPSTVGNNYTWVKMHYPSLEALKLALHDGEDAVLRKDDVVSDPNVVTNRYFVKSLVVENAYKAGRGLPLTATFSPWLSSVIGGRGSGKSSLINFLRILFNRNSDMPTEVQKDFDDFNKLGDKTSGMLTPQMAISAEILKDGKLYLLSWKNASKTHSLCSWDTINNRWSDSTDITNVTELFPLQIFSQKELYSLTKNPSKLLELIDSQFDKNKWTEEKEKLISNWLILRAKKRQLNASIADESNMKMQRSAIVGRISLYEGTEYKSTLENYNNLSKVNSYFAGVQSNITSFITTLTGVQSSIPVIDPPKDLEGIIDENTATAIKAIQDTLQKTKNKIAEATSMMQPYDTDLQQTLNSLPWKKAFDDAKSAYDAILHKISDLGGEPYDTLLQKRGQIDSKIAALEQHKTELETVKLQESDLYKSIIDKEKELRTLRNNVIQAWASASDESNPFLLIELHPMADGDNANSTFRQLIRKWGDDFSRYIYQYHAESNQGEGAIYEIIQTRLEDRWKKREEVLNRLLKATEADRNNLDVRLIRHLQSLLANTPEDIDRLLIWVPEDKLILKFKKDGKTEDIQSGSAGERVAGMLGLLLALNDVPLVIDQPEDDLDTRLISNFVVPGFRKLKMNRQLILVTHNPNIAVNSNSDNVIWMHFQSGQIKVAGNNALQDKAIRQAVCQVMEGGRDALNKRYYRISKALK